VGLFGSIGKFFGGVVKTALKVAPSVIPGGSVVKGLAGTALGLLHHKTPMSSSPIKIQMAGRLPIPILRGQSPTYSQVGNQTQTPAVLRASPVMPGGGIATSQGIMAPGGGMPPASYGGSKAGLGQRRRKRKSQPSSRSSRGRNGRSRRKSGRRLKFGSPAWRKKYMHKRSR
jgi:hypothetical protein